jgi:hypothetical protein
MLLQYGCNQRGENVHPYDIPPFKEEWRLLREAEKRDGLKLEDLQVGSGPVAARARLLTADVEVRYTDGSLVYRGGILSIDFSKVDGNIKDDRIIGSEQWGIYLGLNGMRVGGRRRMTINPKLVCTDIPEGDPLRTQCRLVGSNPQHRVLVRKQTLIVEATLTQSCNPVILWRAVYMFGDYMIKWQACQEEPLPQVTPGDPIWHYY